MSTIATTLPCTSCDGTGRLENDDTDSLHTPMWRTCQDCEGAGVVVLVDPFLDQSIDEPNVLDTVDPAWGLPAAHPDYPARVADREARAAACGHCGGLGFVVTHEDGDAGYRPCHRCPTEAGAA